MDKTKPMEALGGRGDPRDTFLTPGSDEAIAAGCKCPVLDNAHGRGYLGQPGAYCFSSGCELHWAANEQGKLRLWRGWEAPRVQARPDHGSVPERWATCLPRRAMPILRRLRHGAVHRVPKE